MRKIYVFATAAMLILSSCEKENVKESTSSSQNNSQNPLPPGFFATGKVNDAIGINLTGFPFLELCSGELWSTISGTVVFKIATDGSPSPLGIYNFAVRDPAGVLYQRGYALGLEPFSFLGDATNRNTYKLKFIPQYAFDNKLFALVSVADNGNGDYTITMDSGARQCR